MKLFRKVLFWSHLAVGVIAGLVILIMSVTGVLLTYERQITYWADTRNYQVAPPSPEATRLSVEALLAKTREAQPGAAIATVTVRSGASDPAAIGLAGNPAAGPGGGRTIFIDPYTGAVLGEGAKGVRDFFHVMTDWHRWLGAHGASRNTARAVTGASNLGFLFIVASGIYLWWPRKRNWPQFRSIMWFKRGLPGKARDFNWHNVIGIWSAVPLAIIVATAMPMSFPWANALVYRLVGEARPLPEGGPRAGAKGPQARVPLEGLNALWARAEQQVADWRSINLRLPASPDGPAIFAIDRGNGRQPQLRSTLTLSTSTGEVLRWEPFETQTRGRRLRSWTRFTHTGEYYGLIGQTFAGLASAGAVVLVCTGLALALRRLSGRSSRSSVRAAARRISSKCEAA
jgi:uncharacterized iron-regulated membrane protein